MASRRAAAPPKQSNPQLIKKQQSPAGSSSSSPPKQMHYGHNGRSARKLPLRSLLEWLVMVAAVIFCCGLAGLTFLWWNDTTSSTRTGSIRTASQLRHLNTNNMHPLPTDTKLHDEIRSYIIDGATTKPSPTINHLMTTWESQSPLVHIVNTRFMQEQGRLKALGKARLHLFRTFCLPTLVHQSTSNYIWIIKTDPELDAEVLQDLIEDLKPYPNFYLVASNTNFRIRDNQKQLGANSWRDGAEIMDVLESPIYTGNLTQLYQAMLMKDRQVVLETRLDADDGLHKFYLEQIQEKALQQFVGDDNNNKVTPKWLYWCTRRHVEWHGGMQQPVTLPTSKDKNHTLLLSASEPDYYGTLLMIEHSKLCITPGITVGFGIGTASDQVPIHAHDKLFQAIRSLDKDEACGYDDVKDCLELVEDFLVVAVRARTPTSAGMQRVGTEDNDNNNNHDHHDDTHNNQTKKKHNNKQPKQPKVANLRMYLYWDLLHHDFAVLREQVKYTNKYILNHLVPIAQDNLKGQCTSEHSCKEETKEKLLKIIEENK